MVFAVCGCRCAVCTCVVGVLLCSLGCASCLYQGHGAGVSGDCVVWYVCRGCGELVCAPGCLCVVRVFSVGSSLRRRLCSWCV